MSRITALSCRSFDRTFAQNEPVRLSLLSPNFRNNPGTIRREISNLKFTSNCLNKVIVYDLHNCFTLSKQCHCIRFIQLFCTFQRSTVNLLQGGIPCQKIPRFKRKSAGQDTLQYYRSESKENKNNRPGDINRNIKLRANVYMIEINPGNVYVRRSTRSFSFRAATQHLQS